jgi:mono/diheme cytochrome c family protein
MLEELGLPYRMHPIDIGKDHQFHPDFLAISPNNKIKAYLDTLPAVKHTVPPHELTFPYNIRRGLGLWQLLYVDGKTFAPDPKQSGEINRGAYLVQGPGHCSECHSPRDSFGGIIQSEAFAGARNPEGKGKIPNITPSADGIGDWSADDIAYLLETGNTPDFDVIEGLMAPVQENMAKLKPEDRAAIAAYLKSLPPLPDAVPRKNKATGKSDLEQGTRAAAGKELKFPRPDAPFQFRKRIRAPRR